MARSTGTTKPPMPPAHAMEIRQQANLPKLELEAGWTRERRPSSAPARSTLVVTPEPRAGRSVLRVVAVLVIVLAAAGAAALALL